MNIFDTHAHYDDESFNEDRDELLTALPQNGVKFVINQGTNIATSEFSVMLANKYPYIYATVGIHPQDVDKNEDIAEIKKLAQNKKVVAIGEIGLDYHFTTDNKDLQSKYFENQLFLANELDLPVVIHDRDAHKDTLDTLKSISVKNAGVVHCFSGSVEMAKELLNLGYYLGFDGPITFKNSKTALEVLKYAPLDRILVETDSPYLTPEPFRGTRNNSMYIKYIIEKIAEIKELQIDDLASALINNSLNLFSRIDKE